MTMKVADKTQLDKFKDAYPELKCDDGEKRFADKLVKLVKPAPEPSKQ